ncbi:hypothetical protein KIN20_017319, partial [Parelaphostrongylus tenuis]
MEQEPTAPQLNHTQSTASPPTDTIGSWKHIVVDNIDKEYDLLVEYLHVSAEKT